jgi:hypothetical protein
MVVCDLRFLGRYCDDVITGCLHGFKLYYVQGGSNMTGTNLYVNNCKQSRSYLNHLVCLFNRTVSSSNWKGCGRKRSWLYLSYSCWIFLLGLRITTKDLPPNSWPSGRHAVSTPPECKASVVITQTRVALCNIVGTGVLLLPAVLRLVLFSWIYMYLRNIGLIFPKHTAIQAKNR